MWNQGGGIVSIIRLEKKKKKVKIVGMGDSDMVASYRISLGGIIMYIWFDMV